MWGRRNANGAISLEGPSDRGKRHRRYADRECCPAGDARRQDGAGERGWELVFGAGSPAKNFSQTGLYTVGGDTFVLNSGNAAFVVLGAGASQIAFVGASSVLLAGGSGQAIVTADAGSNEFIAGTGTLDVTGGGKDAYVFHANSGLLKLEDFSIAKGDTLTVDKALQGALQQTSDGQGGTMLTFGAGATHGVDIRGMATMPTTSIIWA